MTNNVMISFRQVSMEFVHHGKVNAVLKNFDLDVKQGEFVAVVGPSGGGKSTLINLLAGFIQPTSGQILFADKPVQKADPSRVVVFQDHAVFPWYNVQGNVEYGLRRMGVPKAQIKTRAQHALQKVGLESFAKSFPFTLSGGMRQRVAIARALVMQPQLLLLDEPFASLDSQTRHKLQDDLLELWQENRWTVVFVTHSLEEAVYLADRVVVLDPSISSPCCSSQIDIPRPRFRNNPQMDRYIKTLSKPNFCESNFIHHPKEK